MPKLHAVVAKEEDGPRQGEAELDSRINYQAQPCLRLVHNVMQSPLLEFTFLEMTLLNTLFLKYIIPRTLAAKKYSSDNKACLYQEIWNRNFLNLVYLDDIPWCSVTLQVFDREDSVKYIIYLLTNNVNRSNTHRS